MADTPDTRLQELQARIAARDRIRQELMQAREELDRQTYRLDGLDEAIQITQAELERLEAGGLTSFLVALTGTKAARIDCKREDITFLQGEQQGCTEAIPTLTQSVDRLTAELAGFGDLEAELQALTSDVASTTDSTETQIDPRALERALDAGESLLSSLSGMYGLCGRIRRGSPMMSRSGALLSVAMQTYRNKTVHGLTSQITDSVAHFCRQLEQLGLGREYLPDVCVLLPRLQEYADSSTLGDSIDGWAELEVMTKSIVADLQEEMQRIGA